MKLLWLLLFLNLYQLYHQPLIENKHKKITLFLIYHTQKIKVNEAITKISLWKHVWHFTSFSNKKVRLYTTNYGLLLLNLNNISLFVYFKLFIIFLHYKIVASIVVSYNIFSIALFSLFLEELHARTLPTF